MHKKWIIERTFSWFDNDRRLCRNYELLMENMVKLSATKFKQALNEKKLSLTIMSTLPIYSQKIEVFLGYGTPSMYGVINELGQHWEMV